MENIVDDEQQSSGAKSPGPSGGAPGSPISALLLLNPSPSRPEVFRAVEDLGLP